MTNQKEQVSVKEQEGRKWQVCVLYVQQSQSCANMFDSLVDFIDLGKTN